MPTWFRYYLEGLNNDLAAELSQWFDSELEARHHVTNVLVTEYNRRKDLGIA